MSGLVWFDALFFALMGLAVGSFANVLIVRTPRQTSILTPASHCPGCDMKLRLWHNIPLLSWLFLRGKCAGCKSPISPIYPAIELGGLGLFLLAGWLGGFHPLALLTSAALVMLLALSVIDARDKMVPDSINFAALFLALAGSGIYLFEHLQAALILAGTLALLRLGLSTLHTGRGGDPVYSVSFYGGDRGAHLGGAHRASLGAIDVGQTDHRL